MKRLAAFFCAAVLSLCVIISAGGGVSADFEKDIRQGVAVIDTIAYDTTDNIAVSSSSGTAFFIGKENEPVQYLITNYHVIKDYVSFEDEFTLSPAINGQPFRYFPKDRQTFYDGEQLFFDRKTENGIEKLPYDGRDSVAPYIELKFVIQVHFSENDMQTAEVAAYDEVMDCAVLKLEKPVNKRIPLDLLLPTDEMAGKAVNVYAVGYPGLTDNEFANPDSHYKTSDATITDGIISNIVTSAGTGQVNIQMTCDIKHGNSGGPLVNENGDVLGINTWYLTDGEGQKNYYAISIEHAKKLLDDNNIEYTMADSGTSEETETENTETTAEISETSAEETTTEETSAEETSAPAEEPASSSLPVGVIIAAAAGLIVVVTVIIVIVNKNNSKKASEEQQDTQISPANEKTADVILEEKGNTESSKVSEPQRRAIVRSLAEEHSGKYVHTDLRGIVIGRDPQKCSIIFNDKTPGVSGIHCKIQYDPQSGDFIVTDLGSSYGTFIISTGQKIENGRPCRLQVNERIYLGDPANIISLELE